MNRKTNNEHPIFHGFCDDWDDNTHFDHISNRCESCGNDFEDGKEFMTLECTCVHHSQCLVELFIAGTSHCLSCNT